MARVHEDLGDINTSVGVYKKALRLEAINAEALACLAAHHFYNGRDLGGMGKEGWGETAFHFF